MKKIYLDKNNNHFCFAGSFVFNHQAIMNTPNVFSINLTKEFSHLEANLNIALADFSIPENIINFNDDVKLIIEQLVKKNNKVAFGCMGGIGRTGLLLGVLYKIFDYCNEDELIYKVRENLHEKALETQEQCDFVLNYNEMPLKNFLKEKLFEQKIINCSTQEEFSQIAKEIQNKLNSVGFPNYNFLAIINLYDKKDLLKYLFDENVLDKNKEYFFEGVSQKIKI